MRARNIKPGFYKNEQLAECSMEARLMFPGLWMLADRMGRLEYRPKKIKAELFPYDNLDVQPLLEELENNELIKIYEVDTKKFIWIPTFLEHQSPHNNEVASKLPAHPSDKSASAHSEKGFQPGQKKRVNITDQNFQPGPQVLSTSDKSASAHSEKGFQPGQVALSPELMNPELNTELNNLSHNNNNIKLNTRAREEDLKNQEKENLKGIISDFSDDAPCMEFVELRDYYDRNARPEGSRAGWIEFKRLKKATGMKTGQSYYPGIHALMDDIDKRIADGFWDKGFEPSLAKYLNDRTWEQPVTSRYKQERQADNLKTFRQLETEQENARKANLREKLKAMQEESKNGNGL